MNQNPSPRDTKEQVWTLYLCEIHGLLHRSMVGWPEQERSKYRCLYCRLNGDARSELAPGAQAAKWLANVEEIQVTRLTTAREQVGAAEKERDDWEKAARELTAKMQQVAERGTDLAERAVSERDTALERVEKLENTLREAAIHLGVENEVAEYFRAALDTDRAEPNA